VVVRTDAGAQRTLDAAYVIEHLQHPYALTAHSIQGGTAEWAGVVGRPEDFTRKWSYTALSRAREATELFLIDTPTDQTAKPNASRSASGPPRLKAQLSIRRQERLRDALEHLGPYLSAALGPLPNQPRARSTWQQAATHIEAYRFDHAITDARDALGPPPADTRERAHWQRARQELQRAQRDLGQRIDRGPSHEL
jgi:hypothetical protein